jgi:hypothetical protein
MKRTSSNSKTIGAAIRLGTLAALITLAGAGCSTFAQPAGDPPAGDPPAAAAKTASAKPATPPPNILDCGIVSIGSPSKYACNGKVYTSRQITQMRADWSKQQSSTN